MKNFSRFLSPQKVNPRTSLTFVVVVGVYQKKEILAPCGIEMAIYLMDREDLSESMNVINRTGHWVDHFIVAHKPNIRITNFYT